MIEPLCRQKTKVGLWLFAGYGLSYSLFIGVHVVCPQWTELQVGGIPLGLVGSALLIMLSIVAAVVYHWLCCRLERRAERGGCR